VGNPFDEGGQNPFGNQQPCTGSDLCYPAFLDESALPLWDRSLSRLLQSGKRLVMVGGSDAHGDFNYQVSSKDGIDADRSSDNALGKVRTVVLAPSNSMGDVLDAIKKGRAVVTDGPMLTFGVDLTGDGTIEQDGDAQLGSTVEHPEGSQLEFVFKWQTTPEFGDITKVLLFRGTSATDRNPDTYDVVADTASIGFCDSTHKTAATCRIVLSPDSILSPPPDGTTYYYRAVGFSGPDLSYRCITNPLWVKGAPPAPPPSSAGEPCQRAADCQPGLTCVDSVCQAWCGIGWTECPSGYECSSSSSVCVASTQEADGDRDQQSRFVVSCGVSSGSPPIRGVWLAALVSLLVPIRQARRSRREPKWAWRHR